MTVSPMAGKAYGENMSVAGDTNNRLSGMSYDASGNLLNDGTNNYAYDAESRIKTMNSTDAAYTYDAQGNRVQKVASGATTEYLWFNGQMVAERNPSTGDYTDYIYDGPRRLASANGSNVASITNGGFEQSLTDWTTWGTVTLETNATNAHSGNNYTQLSGASGMMNQFISVNAGDQLTFGGWVNLQSGGGAALGWWLGIYDSTYTPITYIGTSNPTSSGWTYQSATYTVPSGVAYVVLYSQIYLPSGSTTIWVDDGFLSTGTNYYHGDHLGSTRLLTDTGGNMMWSATYAPYGMELNPQATTNHYKFTGKERDSESGLDNFGARYNSSQYGRFMTPDWSDDPDPVPYADFNDPQTLNLYAYVRNNPLTDTDPDGHACVQQSDGSYQDDNSGGQTCAQANDPQQQQKASAVVTASPGPALTAFAINLGFAASNVANDFFRPVVNAMGVQPSYMQNTPTGSGFAAQAGALTGTVAGMVVGPEGEAEEAAETAAVDANKLNHIFGKAAHNLGDLVNTFGSQEGAFKAIQQATDVAVQQRGLTGVFQVTVQVANDTITVRGNVINGIAKIGTAFK